MEKIKKELDKIIRKQADILGLKINQDKTEYMDVDKTANNKNVTRKGIHVLENGTNDLFGMRTAKNGHKKQEINGRITKWNRNFEMLLLLIVMYESET